jgi:LCP family protein required for cell wall assembly
MARHQSTGGPLPDRVTGPNKFKRKRPRRAPIWAVTMVVLGTVLTLTSTASFVGVKVLGNRYEGAVQREDLLGAAVKDKNGKVAPPKVTGPLTFLIIGSDSRAGDNANPDTPDGSAAAVGGQRSDTIILAHIPATMDRAYMISIPRDSYIRIATKDGSPGGKDKVNAAFSLGGAPRLVQTINNYTGGHVDYPVIVDFAAIHKLTELVDGVDVVVDSTSYDPYRFMPANSPYPTTPCRDTHGKKQRCLTFRAGKLHLDAQLAEYYVRQRKGLLRGDLDRAKRQQQYMRALMTKVTTSEFITNGVKFDKLIRTAAGAVTVDQRMPVEGLAFALKSLRPTNLTFMTMPIAADATVPGSGAVLIPDQLKAKELFTALNTDTLDQYVLKYPPNDVSHGA